MILKKLLGVSFFLLLLFNIGYAQEKIIHGLVVVDFEEDHPKGVIITNLKTQTTVETDITGSFKITAAIGDTLYLRSGFLESRKLPLKTIHFKYDPLVIHMNQEVIKLTDIIVRPPLTGDLEKDISSVEKIEDIEKVYANLGIDIRILDINPQEKKEKILPYLGLPTTINIGALVKSLNGDYRKMGNLRQYEELDKKLATVKAYFGQSYFEEVIGINFQETREFLLYTYGQNSSLYNVALSQRDFLSLDQLMRSYAESFKNRLNQRKKLGDK